MKKRSILLVLFILSLLRLLSAVPEIFGDVFSKAGEVLMERVEELSDNEDFFVWNTRDISPVIQIVEQGIGYSADPDKISFTVSYGFSEDDDPPVKLTLGTFYMYAPLKTIIVELDKNGSEPSLKNALKQIVSVGNMVTKEFLALYVEGHNFSLEFEMQAELNKFGAMVMQWYKTPVSQGGAGGDAESFTISDLAYFLGFDGGTYILNTDFAEYKLLEMDNSNAVIGAYRGEYQDLDHPCYRAIIKFDTGEVMIIGRDDSGQRR